MNGRTRTGLAAGVLVLGSLVGWLAASGAAGSGPATSMSLDGLLAELLACQGGAPADEASCTGVVYLWSDLMPLSRAGVGEIRRATERLGVRLVLLDAAELEARAVEIFPAEAAPAAEPFQAEAASATGPTVEDALVRELLAAGATVHNPSLLVVREGRVLGGAILGYKTADAYQALVGERLGRGESATGAGERAPAAGTSPPALAAAWSRDYPVQGRPGAYFRSVPGKATLAFEANGRVWLLDLGSGGTALAPGYIDFVPTPDGRMFVTPAQGRRGLDFYDAREVFEAAARGQGRSVEPVHTDPAMRDQYPSVGILSSAQDGSARRVVYRVLTSWFDRIVYRDYEVVVGGRGRARVTALADPVVACPTVSIPIMSPDGKELAGRDEGTATTRIFALEDGCRPLADLGVQSGKVAWSPDGRLLAFAIPRGAVRDGARTLWVGGDDPATAGIFLWQRDAGRLERVAGSEGAHRIAFPEFVGNDSLAFQLSPGSARDQSVFRLVCCTR